MARRKRLRDFFSSHSDEELYLVTIRRGLFGEKCDPDNPEWTIVKKFLEERQYKSDRTFDPLRVQKNRDVLCWYWERRKEK